MKETRPICRLIQTHQTVTYNRFIDDRARSTVPPPPPFLDDELSIISAFALAGPYAPSLPPSLPPPLPPAPAPPPPEERPSDRATTVRTSSRTGRISCKTRRYG
ncbi:hypothetical protein DERF_014508 [Dermatophagoides farinae]|uniref:Uncharacterized protein n=1 Tax=Dermatophagoides farinae TaxID=6954 RepID=A0A922HIU7_DERFA|nr:hypothetical protein DERF_014508 [Dermatophagoides farinae]